MSTAVMTEKNSWVEAIAESILHRNEMILKELIEPVDEIQDIGRLDRNIESGEKGCRGAS